MKFCDFILCSPKISLAGVENKYLEQKKKKSVSWIKKYIINHFTYPHPVWLWTEEKKGGH